MQDYPMIGIAYDGYTPEWSDGTEVVRAENGRVWLYRHYDREQVTLTVRHSALDRLQELELRQFYRDHKHEHIRFYDPRTNEYYIVLMQGPPRITSMRSARLADIEMVLLGERE